jgi:HAD superfamily hydrolase (TIGR01457 family)
LPERRLSALILDLDGVLYVGETPVEGVVGFMERWRGRGKKVVFVTNNSSLSRRGYVKKLGSMGITARPEEVITSGYLTAEYLRRKAPGAKVYVVGEGGLREELRRVGMKLVVGDKAEEAEYVVVGIDRGFTYRKLGEALRALRAGAGFLATNADPTYPTEKGLLPGAGALVSALSFSSSRKPLLLGKPSTRMYRMALRLLGTKPEETAAVGDRLDLDVGPAKRLGMVSILVLSGVTRREALERLGGEERPDMVLSRLSELVVE